MAMITTIALVHGNEASQTILDKLVRPADDGRGFVAGLQNYLNGIAVGTLNGKTMVRVESATAGERASATLTLTFANITADDTITIGGTVLTWKAAAANENEVTIGADLAAACANLAAKIAAHSVLSVALTAAVTSAGVVTVTALLPGLASTLITLATSDATMVAFLPTTKLGNVTATVAAATRTHNFGLA